MEVIALLPMKGHSERVPDKNLRPLAGRPLYQWVLGTLVGVRSITEVVVDTDSDEIASHVAQSFPDVGIRERPADLVGDDVPMHEIVSRFVKDHGSGDVFVQSHATNPLLRAVTVEQAIAAFLADGEHDSLMTVTEWRTRLYDSSGVAINHDPSVLDRTQDLRPVYEENSNLYIAWRDVIERTGQRVGAHPLLYQIDRIESIDIDEEVDFQMAECMAERSRFG